MENETDDIVNEYIKFAILQEKATLDGDYKKGNYAAKKLEDIYKIFDQDNHLAVQLLDMLLKSENINVRLWASAHALKQNLYVSEAKAILEEISANEDAGILRLNAEMTLRGFKG